MATPVCSQVPRWVHMFIFMDPHGYRGSFSKFEGCFSEGEMTSAKLSQVFGGPGAEGVLVEHLVLVDTDQFHV